MRAPPVMSISVISFLIVLVATSAPDTIRGEAVLDINGDEVTTGKEYYIISAFRGAGGVIPYSRTSGQQTCPLDVVVSPTSYIPNAPVSVSSYSRGRYVTLSQDVRLQFDPAGTCSCPQSSVWRVDRGGWDGAVITTGGSPYYCSDCQFRIETEGDHYKFVHCPRYSYECKNVGVFNDSLGVPRLTLSDQPLSFKFEPVHYYHRSSV